MIEFEKVRYKNFLSTGNTFTEIDLNKATTTLVVGENGAGKSTMIEAISFSLFGKPYRNITKPQLINSINGKALQVEIEFTIGKNRYKIVRGMKPTIFEIYQNGNLINQDSTVRDYQKHLEMNILKLNHKSFHQVVVLGSSSFVPFMELPTGTRRQVIEDLLDIQIFSKMNTLVKETISKIKERMRDLDYTVQVIEEKIRVQRKYIKDITEMNEEYVSRNLDTLAKNTKEIQKLQERNEELQKWIDDQDDNIKEKLNKVNGKRNDLKSYKTVFNTQIKSIVEETQFYEENDHCPTCTQTITETLKNEKIDISKKKAKELKSNIDEVDVAINEVNTEIETLSELVDKISKKQSEISINNSQIKRMLSDNVKLEKEVSDLNNSAHDATNANKELEELHDQEKKLTNEKFTLIEDRKYADALAEMLKDTGIKTKIISEYLPVMNNLINKYLQILDFFVSFHLDENFSEVIKSRHRDDFSYASFSEGEKQRIDLALLFAWRQIARMKNSVSTNLLIMDEVMDASIDAEGLDNLYQILSTLDEKTNVFIISHRQELKDKTLFENVISFVKSQNFSEKSVE
jgi:DNA repair exonuclease SbcCD ATPase subunit